MQFQEIPPAPRVIPEWYQRLELNPRLKRIWAFVLFFSLSISLLSFLTTRQLLFENLKRKSTTISGKVLALQSETFTFEIFIEEEEEDFHFVLTEPLPSGKILVSGETIQVFYVAQNPRASLSQFQEKRYALWIGICFLSTVLFGGGSLKNIREFFRRKEVYREGEPLRGLVKRWEKKSHFQEIQLEALRADLFKPLSTVCKLPLYVSPLPPETEIWVLAYQESLAYYWNPEKEFQS
jgi:hypothetical protein